MQIKGKTFLITGASAGIGREMARLAAARGGRVALFARRADAIEKVVAELGPDLAIAVPGDITNQEQIEQAVARTVERFGGLDVLVNNAGVGYFGPVATMKTGDFQRLVHTNVLGPVQAIQAALPHLERARGLIVNVSSSLSKRALPYLAAYSGTKAMLDSISEGLRLELKSRGVRVLSYGPPEVETDFAAQALRDPAMPPATGRRGAKVTDVARRIVAAIAADRREVIEVRFLQIGNVIAPRLLDLMFLPMVAKMGPRKE